MRGLRLFIRPIESGDSEAVRSFLEQHGGASDPPECGLLGKLLGELVAVLGMEIAGGEIRLVELVVAPEFRRKRVGRAMVEELAALAAKMECAAIVVPDTRGADEFLRRTGFVPVEGGVVRRVARREQGL